MDETRQVMSKVISFPISDDDYKALERMAGAQGKAVTTLAKDVVAAFVNHPDKQRVGTLEQAIAGLERNVQALTASHDEIVSKIKRLRHSEVQWEDAIDKILRENSPPKVKSVFPENIEVDLPSGLRGMEFDERTGEWVAPAAAHVLLNKLEQIDHRLSVQLSDEPNTVLQGWREAILPVGLLVSLLVNALLVLWLYGKAVMP
jgi:hypothetical protein